MANLKNVSLSEIRDSNNNSELELFLLGFYYHELGQEQTFVTTWTVPTGKINIYKINYDMGTNIKKIDKGIYNHIDDSVIKSFVMYNSKDFRKNYDFEYIPDKDERVKNDCTKYASHGSYIKNYNPILFECFTGGNSYLLFKISENNSKYELSYKEINEENNIEWHSLGRYGEMLDEVQPLLEKYEKYNSLEGFQGLRIVDTLTGIYSYIKETVEKLNGDILKCGCLLIN